MRCFVNALTALILQSILNLQSFQNLKSDAQRPNAQCQNHIASCLCMGVDVGVGRSALGAKSLCGVCGC